jgi:hypothetical protein
MYLGVSSRRVVRYVLPLCTTDVRLLQEVNTCGLARRRQTPLGLGWTAYVPWWMGTYNLPSTK